MGNKSDKILKIIETNFIVENDKYNTPSLINVSDKSQTISLSTSMGRKEILISVKNFLFNTIGFDEKTSLIIADKYVEHKYNIWCDFIKKM